MAHVTAQVKRATCAFRGEPLVLTYRGPAMCIPVTWDGGVFVMLDSQ